MYSPCPVACFSDEDDVSGNQNNCYWTRAIKRFALFDLLKSLYSDTKIYSVSAETIISDTFSLYENASFIIVSAETEYILVSEYKLFNRSNKANLFIALVQ